jgi:hypothetical protein
VALTAIRAGAALAARRMSLALPLYLTSLLLGALPATLVAVGFTSSARGRSWGWPPDGGWANRLAEVAVAAESLPYLGGEPSARVGVALGSVLLAVLAAVLALAGQGLAYTFLSGGILVRLREREAPFWAACRRWYGPLLRLGILEIALLALVGLPGALLIGSLASPLGRMAELVAAIGWLSLIGGWLELARAWMVVREEPVATRAVGAALRAARNLNVLGVWLLLGASSSALIALQGSALAIEDPAGSLAATQALLLVGAWLKVLRLAVMVWLCEGLTWPVGP